MKCRRLMRPTASLLASMLGMGFMGFPVRPARHLVRCSAAQAVGGGGAGTRERAAAAAGIEGARYVPTGAIVAPLALVNLIVRETKKNYRPKKPTTSSGNKRVLCPYMGPSPLPPLDDKRLAKHTSIDASPESGHDTNPGIDSAETRERRSRLMAVFLPVELAWALEQDDAKERIPKKIWELLETRRAAWVPGLRPGSRDCLGPDVVLENCPSRRSDARFHYVELFAGIGGFRVALDGLGGQCVMASEVDEHATSTYRANYGEYPIGDITEVVETDIPPHDILTAGFPCQAFSVAGEQRGLADRNGNLFFEVTRVLRGSRPKAFILENVPALITLEGGQTMNVILKELRGLGYKVSYKVLRSNPLVPQKRRRVYIVGLRSDDDENDSDNRNGYNGPDGGVVEGKKHEKMGMTRNTNGDGGERAKEGGGMEGDGNMEDWHKMSLDFDWPVRLMLAEEGGPHFTDEGAGFPTVRQILESDVPDEYTLTDTQWNAVLARARASKGGLNRTLAKRLVALDGQARTVISSYHRSHEGQSQFVLTSEGVNASREEAVALALSGVRPRFFTEREVARLQGFPDCFDLTACHTPKRVYHQLGNAVCPPVVAEIAKRLVALAEL